MEVGNGEGWKLVSCPGGGGGMEIEESIKS